MENIINGLISGYIGAILVYPIDFIKTHIQNNNKISNIKFRHIYRGSFIQLIGIGPEKTIKLFVNDKLISNDVNPILAGACAGCCQVLITNPIEYIKIQYQMNLHKQMKLSKMFHGVQLCLARDIPFSAIYFPTYFLIKS
jgi:solute carrier family 25 aspartate/glutamate transporter 12/13